ncbi:hypothetical protein LTR78_005986 [Recurvomyces mirabilis]|uniref:DH domain-containing protein n=1 Tax=Recurvomyces mirabilis TaxID=574656 RepID=A0AAE1C0V9_9PEZI|nr:hypothetical protein LTR78_005986 [Recurvomyces mirabilis]KAK5155203.1 hypothetical protein LTS14_006158 [Recurvomyces mirabilis]
MFPAMQAQVFANERFSRSGPSLESTSSYSTVVQRRNVRSFSTSSLSSGGSSVLGRGPVKPTERRLSLSAVFSRGAEALRGSDCDRPIVKLVDVDEDVENPCTISDAGESIDGNITIEEDTVEQPARCRRGCDGLAGVSGFKHIWKMAQHTETQEERSTAAHNPSNLPSFVAYDDFGEHYELLRLTVVDSQQSIQNWPEYDAAFETLAYTLNPLQRRNDNQKRALRVRDLLIKPIQRLPRYMLLFQDLQKLTPVCDDPGAHAGLEDIVGQLEAACERLNRSRRSLDHTRVLDSTWLVSERLSFHNQLPRVAFLKLLGNVELCGCLHIAYRSKEEIKGRYVISVLFETTLLLAIVDDADTTYNVLAGIALGNVTMAETDNGRGLQCHTAPHSWKLVYEHQTRMYELIFTACSGTEARVWRERIAQCAMLQTKVAAESNRGSFELFSPLVDDMRTIGKAMGKAGSFVRRMSHDSIRRAATVASTTNLSQVIIKNTQACKEALDPAQATLQIPRSQSVATPSHVQTLAPRRAERIRIEALLSDVWTKDVLPYPGMTPRRSDPIRASANHVMRKFSMASITSNFSTSKRNASYSSMSSSRKEDMPPPRTTGSGRDRRPTRPPPVSFQTAPDAFLPEDFTVGGTMPRTKRSALRTLTMTLERPFSPAPSERKPEPLRRAQSVHDANSADTPPAYTVVQQRANTPAPSSTGQGTAGASEAGATTPRKTQSKSRLLRMFA